MFSYSYSIIPYLSRLFASCDFLGLKKPRLVSPPGDVLNLTEIFYHKCVRFLSEFLGNSGCFLDRLPDDRLQPFGGRTVGITEVYFVVLPERNAADFLYFPMNSLDIGAFS